MEPQVAYIIAAVSAALAVVLHFSGVKSLRRKRLIENVPTSKVAGVFIGLTEVKGQAEDDEYLRSYLAELECVWYSYKVQEQWRKTETYTDSKGHRRTRTTSGWTTVRSGEILDPFFVRDDTGRLRIVPDKAEIEGTTVMSRTCTSLDPIYYRKGPAGAIAHSTGVRSFTEYAIRPKQAIYVIGTARLRQDVVEPEIAHDPEDEMYLISVNSEEKILSSYAWGASLKLIFGTIFCAGAPLGALAEGKPDFGAALGVAWPFMLLAVFVYLALIFVRYLFLVYNGLVNVRNRLAKAWSLIDIQLKRRFDLIPNLVSCAQGYAKHEKEIHESLARIRVEGVRGGGGVSPGTVPVGGAALVLAGFADQQTHALGSLFGITERYPKLLADRSFAKLMEELSNTETKIALARSFFNESVTALNNRIETMPDALVARLGNFKKADWFKIEEFEKAPPVVKIEPEPAPKPEPKAAQKDAPRPAEPPPPPPPRTETARA